MSLKRAEKKLNQDLILIEKQALDLLNDIYLSWIMSKPYSKMNEIKYTINGVKDEIDRLQKDVIEINNIAEILKNGGMR